MFYGIGAAVIGIIARSAFKLTKLTIGERQAVMGSIFVAGGLDGMDFTGDYLALSPGWSSEPIRESLSQPVCRPQAQYRCSWRQEHSRRLLQVAPGCRSSCISQGGNVRIRQRIGRRALPLRWRSRRASLANRPAIRGRGRSGHDYTGTCGHHGRFYRLAGGGAWRRYGGSSRHLSSGLPGCGCSRTFLQALGEEPAVECVRARRHCRRYRSNCRGGGGPCSSLGLRSAHNSDLFAEPRHTVSLENTRARSYRVCWRCRFASTLCVKNRDGDE